jgi:hypothetical protein
VLRGMPYSPSLLLLAKPRSCDASKSCCDASKSWRSAMLVFSMDVTSTSRGKRLADGEANTRMEPVTSAVRPSSKRSCMRRHYTITSSARASRVVGALRPMPLPGGRLIT